MIMERLVGQTASPEGVSFLEHMRVDSPKLE